MIKAVIFDMDGVIADTEPLHEKARVRVLKSLGLDAEAISPLAIGRCKRAFWSEVAEKCGLNYTADELTDREFKGIIELAREEKLQPTTNLRGLLERLRADGIATAVASSSDKTYVNEILDITNLGEFFKVRASGDEVPAAKPAPDVYLKALDELGVKAADSLAVEDSDTGAQAAVAAGIRCVAYDVITDPALKQKFAVCEYKVNDMSKIASLAEN